MLVKKTVKKLTKFRPQVRSRHPSHIWFRENLGLLPFRSVIRFGSTTSTKDIFIKRTPEQISRVIECNTVEAVKTSSNKLLMKQAFTKGGVKTAPWIQAATEESVVTWSTDKFPIVAKHIYGSRGEGNYLINNRQELDNWFRGKTLSNYIFEEYKNFNREYRLHVTSDGCFYTCRKMLKSDVPKDKRWFRNDTNCVWVLEDNASFDKPSNWDAIVAECVKALKAVGLDVAGFDVKVQSTKTEKGRVRENPDFIVIESNSACSHGEITKVKYLEAVTNLLIKKYENKQ